MKNQEEFDIETEDEEIGMPLWSFKLITGEHIIAELYDTKDRNTVTMASPIVVIHEADKGGEVTYAKEFDATTDDDEWDIHLDKVLASPAQVNHFYRLFYVKAQLFSFIKHTRQEMGDTSGLTEEEAKKIIAIAEDQIAHYIDYLAERYDIHLQRDPTEPPLPEPGNTLH